MVISTGYKWIQLNLNMRIALFGGAFDPPHLGHFEVIIQVLRFKLVDEVWLLPNFSGTWKNSVSAGPEQRLEMCRILAQETNNPQIKVSDFEIKKAGVSYSLATVRELKQLFPENDFFWLMGSDLMAQVPNWENCEGLTEELAFLIFPRTKTSSTEIRQRLRKQQPITGLVSQKVERYIKNHKLY